MAWFRMLVLATLMAVGVIAACAAQPSPDEALDSRMRHFLDLTRSLADNGHLDDPDKVERLLGVSLRLVDEHQYAYPACPDGSVRTTNWHGERKYAPTSPFWYSQELGAKLGHPVELTLRINRYRLCNGSGRDDAEISFDDVDKLFCIRETDVHRILPGLPKARWAGPHMFKTVIVHSGRGDRSTDALYYWPVLASSNQHQGCMTTATIHRLEFP